jgi:hypothetical protein
MEPSTHTQIQNQQQIQKTPPPSTTIMQPPPTPPSTTNNTPAPNSIKEMASRGNIIPTKKGSNGVETKDIPCDNNSKDSQPKKNLRKRKINDNNNEKGEKEKVEGCNSKSKRARAKDVIKLKKPKNPFLFFAKANR